MFGQKRSPSLLQEALIPPESIDDVVRLGQEFDKHYTGRPRVRVINDQVVWLSRDLERNLTVFADEITIASIDSPPIQYRVYRSRKQRGHDAQFVHLFRRVPETEGLWLPEPTQMPGLYSQDAMQYLRKFSGADDEENHMAEIIFYASLSHVSSSADHQL